jgi:hypothetical protein
VIGRDLEAICCRFLSDCLELGRERPRRRWTVSFCSICIFFFRFWHIKLPRFFWLREVVLRRFFFFLRGIRLFIRAPTHYMYSVKRLPASAASPAHFCNRKNTYEGWWTYYSGFSIIDKLNKGRIPFCIVGSMSLFWRTYGSLTHAIRFHHLLAETHHIYWLYINMMISGAFKYKTVVKRKAFSSICGVFSIFMLLQICLE